ncbi:putative Ig domain-containing protein [Embleya sp. NBC_00888]|uniref:alkaline phosphatase family protein n=1 Tax=Embleya sp. NBC_00888 TaxID=2975960 RepID=UPI00386B05E1|nr:putative Ig domain-containing protein [Embleya sp. NBC_00888]
MFDSGSGSRSRARGKPRSATFVALSVAIALGAITAVTTPASAGAPDRPKAQVVAAIPRYDHVVVVVHENANHEEIIGNSQAPYINQLAAGGASFTDFHGETHPSQPNYMAMFSGSTQGVTGDECPPPGSPYAADNLAKQLIDVGATWGSYNEDWSAANPGACTSGSYARKHNPWLSFANVPAATTYPATAFPTDYNTLPTISYVVPNQCNDMHDRLFNPACGISTGDTWTRNKLSGYAEWAKTHNSLLVVTWDEDNFRSENRIATVLYGAHVKPGRYAGRKDHYSLLRTFEDMYGTRRSGQAATATPITEVWQDGGPSAVSVVSPGGQSGVVGRVVSLAVVVSGGSGPYTCVFQGLPVGLSAAGGGCVVSGSPSVSGTSQVSVTAADSVGAVSAPVSFGWTVAATPSGGVEIASPGARVSRFDQRVTVAVRVSGGTAPYSCVARDLPAGLFLSPFTCVVSGRAWGVGSFAVEVTATDAVGAKATAAFPWNVTWF